MLAEGLNLLAGAPKLGKSWFALNVATAVAYGGMALDKIAVERGEALYLVLEDPPRRLQRRLRLIPRQRLGAGRAVLRDCLGASA